MYYYVFLLYNSKQMRQKKENKKNNYILKKYLLFSLTYSMISTVDGPLVKRLRRCPLTAETGVRFPYGLLYFL